MTFDPILSEFREKFLLENPNFPTGITAKLESFLLSKLEEVYRKGQESVVDEIRGMRRDINENPGELKKMFEGFLL